MAEFCVAITGGIASGKSAVAAEFERLGRTVVDADQIARVLVAPGQPALQAIRERFGAEVLQADGQLDRAWLRAHVFAQGPARRDLEAILHPRIRAALRQGAAEAAGPYVLIAVPLLAEGGGRAAYPWLQRILVVDVPEALQIDRLCQRDGGSREQARLMLRAQAGRAQRLALADDVLVNDGPRSALAAMAQRLDRRYRQLATAPSPSA